MMINLDLSHSINLFLLFKVVDVELSDKRFEILQFEVNWEHLSYQPVDVTNYDLRPVLAPRDDIGVGPVLQNVEQVFEERCDLRFVLHTYCFINYY